MKLTYFQLISSAVILLIFAQCRDEEDPTPVYDPQTTADVMANREYYFTCYMNGELWYTVPPSDNSPYWELSMEFDNTPTYVGEGKYGHFNFMAHRYPDQSDPIEKTYFQEQVFQVTVDRNSNCGGIEHIDTIPFQMSFDSSEYICINFFNGFYRQGFLDSLESGEENNYIQYTDVTNFHLWIDSVKTYNAAFEPDPNGWSDVVWGRMQGDFANAMGDTLKIREGIFKIKEGTWRHY